MSPSGLDFGPLSPLSPYRKKLSFKNKLLWVGYGEVLMETLCPVLLREKDLFNSPVFLLLFLYSFFFCSSLDCFLIAAV